MVEKMFDVSIISSHHERFHYGKMAAVSVTRMRTGSYAYLIALIIFGIPNQLVPITLLLAQ